MEIRLYFTAEANEKAQYREHYLILSGYGSEEQQERQTGENFVVAERMESVEFNEPTADFYKSMTAEEQFNWLKVKKGRGKGKKPEYVFEGEVEPTSQVPDRAIGDVGLGGGTWTQQYERQLIAGFGQSERMLGDMIEEEKRAMERRKLRMEELGRQIDAKG